MPTPPTCSCARCGSLLDYAPGAGLADVCFSCIAASLVVEPLPPESPGASKPTSDGGAPRVIASYELLREIARGGMGVVWLAKHRPTGRRLALKMLPHNLSADPVRLTRFRSEATLAARLIHPGIVTIRAIGDDEGVPFFVMDYIEGQDLGALARNRPMPHREAARIVLAVATAIQFAHEQGVLHRDLKPSNILLDADQQPHVSDFGIAKLVEPSADLTGTGEVLGSPSFMAPEQVGSLRGSAGVRTDVYGLGGLLYFCLTGRAPFMADSIPATLQKVLASKPVPPSQWTAGIPPALDRIVLRCLEKDPSRRFASAAGLAAELERALRGEPLHTCDTSRSLWLAQRLRFSWGSAWLILCGVGLAGAAALATLRLGHRMAGSPTSDQPNQNALLQYVTDVTLAGRALAEGDSPGARRFLGSVPPANGVFDPRGFEWHWLLSQTAPRTPTLAFSVSGTPRALRTTADGRQILLADSNSLCVIPFAGGPAMVRHRLPASAGHRSIILDASGRFCWVGDEIGVHQLDLVSGSWRSFHPGPVADLNSLDSGHAILARISHSDGSSHDLMFNGSTGAPMDSSLVGTPTSPARACSVARSSNGLRMAWTDPDGMLRIQNLSNRLIEIATPVPHAVTSRWVFDSSGSNLVQYGSPSARVTVRRAPVWSEEFTIGAGSQHVLEVCFLPDPLGLLTLSQDGLIRSWPLRPKPSVSPWDGPVPEDVYPSVVISPDGSRLAVGWISGGTTSGRVWSCHDVAVPPTPFKGLPIAFSANADQIVSWHEDGHLERAHIDRPSEAHRFRLNPSPGTVPDQLSPDAGFFACLGNDGRLRFVHARSGQLLAGPTRSVRSWLLSPDGDHFLFTGIAGTFLGSLRSPEMVEIARGDIRSMAFHPQGRITAVGSDTGHIHLFDVVHRKRMAELDGSPGSITALAFSPDGRSLASGSDDGSIRFWNSATWREVLKTRLQSGIRSLVFHPDGRRLVVVRHRAIETLDASGGSLFVSSRPKSNPGGFWDTPATRFPKVPPMSSNASAPVLLREP